VTYTQWEQLDLAADLIMKGFGPSPLGHGAVALTLGSYTASGQMRDREYKLADGTIGQRVKELGEVLNGFDYYIETIWAGGTGQTATVTRTLQLAYPRAGSEQDVILEDRNILGFGYDEDATTLASRTYAIGEAIVSAYEDDKLITVDRLPFFERTISHGSVTETATLDDYAHALWDDSQMLGEPSDLTILANVHPGIGDWSLGDVVTVLIEESINFPHGLRVEVRILGWIVKPPASGPETLQLVIIQEGPIGDYTGAPIPIA
jgi:hypothetical protein